MSVLSKSQRVLDYVWTSKDGRVQFVQSDMESGMESKVLIPEQDWIDFGSPEQITVTICAGDMLNRKSNG